MALECDKLALACGLRGLGRLVVPSVRERIGVTCTTRQHNLSSQRGRAQRPIRGKR